MEDVESLGIEQGLGYVENVWAMWRRVMLVSQSHRSATGHAGEPSRVLAPSVTGANSPVTEMQVE